MGNSRWMTPAVKQWWCSSSMLVANVGLGMVLGFTACLLPALQAKDSAIKVDIGMTSWLTAVFGPGSLLGIAAACCCLNRFGRRVTKILCLIPGIVGWTMICSAESYQILFIGRMLTSITTGASSTAGCVMVAECASPNRRGMILNLKSTSVTVGTAVSHILGNYIHWRTIAIVSCVPLVISLAIALTWPESPYWLASKKQYDKCNKEFLWLRGKSEESVREVTELVESQKERFSQQNNVTSTIIEFFKKFTMKDFLKPLFIIMFAYVVKEASGRHFFPAYALQIMNEVVGTATPVHYYMLCIDVIVIVSTMASAVLIKMTKIRILLFTSGFGALLVLVVLCLFLFLTSAGIIPTYPWITTFLFIVYFSLQNLGCSPIPLVLQGELFPLAHKEVGLAIAGVFLSMGAMGTLKVTPYLVLSLNVYGTFAVYGVIMAVSLLILYFTLPETKDKTLQEIENFFKYGKYQLDEEPDEVYDKMLVEDDGSSSCVVVKD